MEEELLICAFAAYETFKLVPNLSLTLKQATLMTEFKESIINDKKYVITSRWQILSQTEILDQLDFLDNDVDRSSC
jgi:hypothetical protein